MYAFRIALIACLILVAPVAHAAMEALVAVDESSDNVMHARSTALMNGEQKAFFVLLGRIAPQDALELGTKISPSQISTMVHSFEIKSEKMTAGRYQAEVNYIFNSHLVEQFLSSARGLAPGAESNALLVIPAYQDAEKLKLWERDNPWRQALSSVAMEVGQGALVLPFGDPRDTQAIDQETLLAGDRAAFTTLAERYGTRNVVIATAREARTETGLPAITVVLRRPGAAQVSDAQTLQFPAVEAGDTFGLLLVRAAREVAQKLATGTEQFALNAAEREAGMQARVVRAEFRHSREWMTLRRSFEDLPGVEYSDLGAIAPHYAQLTLYYRGSDAMIQKTLAARGVVLEDLGQYWRASLLQP